MDEKRYLAGGLAVVGGALMVLSGYASRGFLLMALGYIDSHLSDVFSGEAVTAANIAITVLEIIIALGGITVIIGGLVVIERHSTIGRLLILLGGAGGFLGLLISLGITAYEVGGLSPIISYLPYWVGLALAVVGRRLAKGS